MPQKSGTYLLRILGFILSFLMILIFKFSIQITQTQTHTTLTDTDLTLSLELEKGFVWFDHQCLSGNWSVTGEVNEVYLNGIWQTARSGNFQNCNLAVTPATLNINRGAEFVREIQLEPFVLLPTGVIFYLILLLPAFIMLMIFPNRTYYKRFQRIKYLLLILVIITALPVLRFVLMTSQPNTLTKTLDNSSVSVNFSQTAIFFQHQCISGSWEAENVDTLYVDTIETETRSGEFEKCGFEDPLVIRLVFEEGDQTDAIVIYFPVLYPASSHIVLLIIGLMILYWLVGLHQLPDHVLSLVLMIMHISLSYTYIITQSVPMDRFWEWDSPLHTIDMNLMRENFLESIFYLHMQPPLLNILGFSLDALFGEYMPIAMQAIFVFFGATMVVCTFFISEYLSNNRFISLCAALLVGVHPAIFTYESMMFYTLPTTFLITLSVYILVRYKQTDRLRELIIYLVLLNILILLRSIYHIVILLPAIIFVAVLAKKQWRRIILIGGLISLMSIVWYGKNALVFDTFSSSTWLGNSLWKVAAFRYEIPQLSDLYDEGILLNRWPYEIFETHALPSQYPDSFNKTSDIPVLSQDNQNNINYPDIMDTYEKNALALITYDPKHYLLNVRYAYGLYTAPTEEFYASYPLMQYHQEITLSYFYGSDTAEWLVQRLSLPQNLLQIRTMWYFFLLLWGIAYPIYSIILNGISISRWIDFLRNETIIAVLWGFFAYTTFVSIFFELGENARFRYLTEPLQIIYFTFSIYWLFRHLKSSIKSRFNK